MYYDGHEREETIAARHVFLEKKRALYRRALFWFVNEKGEMSLHKPDLRDGEKPVIFVYHDEASAKTNDEQRSYWASDWAQVLRKKNDGANFMVSDFIDSFSGYVNLTDDQFNAAKVKAAADTASPCLLTRMAAASMMPEQPKARVLFATGRGGDECEEANTDHGVTGSKWCNAKGYWDNRSMVRHVNLLIRIFNIKYPNHEMVLVVDNSSGHYAVGDAGLSPSAMNLNPGGKTQAKPDDGFYFVEDAAWVGCGPRPLKRVVHPLCDGLDGFNRLPARDVQGLPCVWYVDKESKKVWNTMPTCAVAKGLKKVLNQRWQAGARYANGTPMQKDPATMNLEECRQEIVKFQDFEASKSRLELLCSQFGHTCLFLPKFHPELNPIELNWRDSKNELRRWCKCSSKGFKERWHKALDAITNKMIQRYFKSAMEFEAVYDKVIGFGNEADPDAKVMLYKRHRHGWAADSLKAATKGKLADKVAEEDKGQYLVKVKDEKKLKKRCKESEYKVQVADEWGLLRPLVDLLANEKAAFVLEQASLLTAQAPHTL